MGDEYFIRAESFDEDIILDTYAESKITKEIIDLLLSNTPLLIEGSRGTGKTFLMKVAFEKIKNNFENDKILPVYVSFQKSMMIPEKYEQNWMLSKILSEIKSSLKKVLCIMDEDKKRLFDSFFGFKSESGNPIIKRIDLLIKTIEDSWKDEKIIDETIFTEFGINTLEIKVINETSEFLNLCEFICDEFEIKKIIFFFDEACHNFLPNQRREFFTLFRNLTHNRIVCKATIYPGIPSFGEVFQSFHEVEIKKLNMRVSDENYLDFMREVFRKNISSNYKLIERNAELLNTLIYASSGNPRIMIKSIKIATNDFKVPLKTNKINEIIKDFYRNDIWNDHNELLEKYIGYKKLVEWGKNTICEDIVDKIKEKNKNQQRGCFFAIDNNSTKTIRRSFDILEYSGITMKTKKNYRKHINNRNREFSLYDLNFGIILSEYSSPNNECREMMDNFNEKTRTFPTSFKELNVDFDVDEQKNIELLNNILDQSVEKLEMSCYLKNKCIENGFVTIRNILERGRDGLMEICYVKEIRSRTIFDEAQNAILEYISG